MQTLSNFLTQSPNGPPIELHVSILLQLNCVKTAAGAGQTCMYCHVNASGCSGIVTLFSWQQQCVSYRKVCSGKNNCHV